jgi:hypothetical protein
VEPCLSFSIRCHGVHTPMFRIILSVVRLNKKGNVRKRNNEARSCNHVYSGKAMGIAYSECVFVALGTQHAMRVNHIASCGLHRSTIFSHIIS